MQTTKRAFTLIELLVVVSIIALLVGILLPSLQDARRQARGVLCLTHLRQLSHGWHMYADDNNDVCLPGRYANAGGGTANPANWFEIGNGMKYRPRWVATMGLQVGAFAFNQPSTTNDRQDYDNAVYSCPAVPEWIDERNYAFGYNHQFLGNARRTAGRYHRFPVKRTRIASFSGTVMATDCMGTAAGFGRIERKSYNNDGTGYDELANHAWTLDPPRLTKTSDRGSGDADSPRTAPDPRHNGRTNVIYCDGHGETQTVEQLGYRTDETGAFRDLDYGDDPPTNRWFSGTGHDDAPPDLPQ